MSEQIAIVGAGISGLLAARELSGAGHAVRVFDKARGPGGRMATRRYEDLAFDHGAQYFTVRNTRFRREVERWVEQGVAARWDARLVEAGDGQRHVHQSEYDRYVGVPRMSAITRYLSADLEVTLGTRVRSISREGSGWRLRDDSGDLGRFGTVLVTTPPEQAVSLLAAAPDLVAVASSVTSAPCWAAMAAFDRPLDASFDGAFVSDERLAWAARNNSKPGRLPQEAWVLHGAAAWSRAHAEAPAETVVDSLVTSFFEATGLEPRVPVFATAHRWLLAMAEQPLAVGAAWDATGTLSVCGDWCNGCRVEGAASSGLAAVDAWLGRGRGPSGR